MNRRNKTFDPTKPTYYNPLVEQIPFTASAGRDETHSIGIKVHPRGLAKELLHRARTVETSSYKLEYDDPRPLIDKLHEATFHNPVGLQWYENKYGLRDLIRKAHCFTLDDRTSSMVADFSIAIAHDLDSARQLAIPPFPVTWIDHNNVLRLRRMKELGGVLTESAQNEPVPRVGWLIHEADTPGWFAHYVTHVGEGMMAAPLAFYWHAGPGIGLDGWVRDETQELVERLTLGVRDTNVAPGDAHVVHTPLHKKMKGTRDIYDLMIEVSGELRHIWGALIAIGGPHGTEVKTSTQERPPVTHSAPNGKPLLPLEHKILHLHLGKKQTPDKIIIRHITNHKKRWHEVRSHWRTLKSGRMVPVKSHERGDERLGRITKTYVVEK